MEVSTEANRVLVDGLDELGLVVETDNRGDRAEDLVLDDVRLRVHIHEHGGLEEVAGVERLAAAGGDLCAGFDGAVDHGGHVGELLFGHERSDVGGLVEAVADLLAGDAGGELLGELVVDVGVHEEVVGCVAGLAHVAHLCGDGGLHGLVDVRVFEHDERRVAAELHGGAQDVLGCFLQERLAHLG